MRNFLNNNSKILAGLIGWRLCVAVVALGVVYFVPSAFNELYYYLNFHWPVGEAPTWMSALKTWDAQHYLYLAEFGYRGPVDLTYAFFPLWPAIIWLGTWLTGGNYLASGLFLSNVFAVIGLYVFYRLVEKLYDSKLALWSLLLILVYPGALFFSFAYSESLFFVLALSVMWFLLLGRWWLSAFFSFFLPLTRVVGIFIMVPMFYEFYKEYKEIKKINWPRVVSLLFPLLGLGAYFAVMYVQTGHAFIGFNAQSSNIAHRSIVDLFNVPQFVLSFFQITGAHNFLYSALDRFWFILFLLALIKLWKTNRTLFFYALFLGLAPAMTSFMSYTRYFLMIFPVFIAGAMVLENLNKYLQWFILAGLLGIQFIFLIGHLNNFWVG